MTTRMKPFEIHYVIALQLMLMMCTSAQQNHYVKQINTPPTNCPGQPCLTLDQYAQQQELYFTTGATFLFLAGNHTLVSEDITLSNLSNITLKIHDGDDFSVFNLLCTQRIFTCVNVSNLTIMGLTFIHDSNSNQNISESVFLALLHSRDVFIANSTFKGSESLDNSYLRLGIFSNGSIIETVNCLFAKLDGAVLGLKSDLKFIETTFTGNKVINYGGAIAAFDSNTIFLVNCTLERNSAKLGGGAIHIGNGVLVSEGSTFIENKAETELGGAIYSTGENSTVETIACLFEKNTAVQHGGAIGVVAGAVTCQASRFVENAATGSGGALFALASSIEAGSCCFEKNTAARSGGAIIVSNSAMFALNGNFFTKNKALVHGGAVFVHRSSVKLKELGNTFTNNLAAHEGGAIAFSYSSITVSNICVSTDTNTKEWPDPSEIAWCTLTFFNNTAQGLGGGISAMHSSMTLTTTHLYFSNNRADQYSGGAIYALGSNLTLGATNCTQVYSQNSCGIFGGAVSAENGTLKIEGKSYFVGNRQRRLFNGGALFIAYSFFILSGNASFVGNTAHNGGAISLFFSSVIFNGSKAEFKNNSAVYGGGMYVIESLLVGETEEEIVFIENNASNLGGGIFALKAGFISLRWVRFVNNKAIVGGGAVHLSSTQNILLHSIKFINNSQTAVNLNHISFANFRGTTFEGNTGDGSGAVFASSSVLSFTNQTLFKCNKGQLGGAISAWSDTELLFDNAVVFTNNTADNGGAIYAFGGAITFNGTADFISNIAVFGGAMYLNSGTTLSFKPFTNLAATRNNATAYGGVIYHVDVLNRAVCSTVSYGTFTPLLPTLPKCFIGQEGIEPYINVSIYSYNNSAGLDGSLLYGGFLDRCQLGDLLLEERLQNFTLYGKLLDKVIHIEHTNDKVESITSSPYQLCFCESDSSYNCTEDKAMTVYRGEKFRVHLLATGQGSIITPTNITAQVSPTSGLSLNQTLQSLPRHCTEVAYNVHSIHEKDQLTIYPSDGPCRDTGLAAATVNLTFRPCPDGFTQARERCVCEERLKDYGAECIINEGVYITRNESSMLWMSTLYVNGSYQGLILYKTCPVQYCTAEQVQITLDREDVQCEQNRRGVLCGACSSNYSLVFGSSQCLACSDTYLALLLPFAAAGILLVVFLSLLRLTVATGMINSIILYANIVQANKELFYPSQRRNILTVLAWLNLDLGFQTCFYDGMDAYAQTWLQFAFPAYVWTLVSLIIVASRYSILLTKLIGSNPIAVLATLLLMSYTKILKVTIDVYSSVDLDYPDNKTVTVWLKDANLPFLESKHLFLTVATSLVLVFFFLPYTAFLLLGYKLYPLSGKKHLRTLLAKTKPLLDSYYAPYKLHTRYWTGLLLLVRCALYIVFSFNSLGATDRSLLAIIVTFTAIVVIAWFSGSIYKNTCVNILEGSIYFNIIILAAATSNKAHTETVVYLLIGTVLATSAGIVLYHAHLLFAAKLTLWQKLREKLAGFYSRLKKMRVRRNQPLPLEAARTSSQDPHKIISRKAMNFREPLLEDEQTAVRLTPPKHCPQQPPTSTSIHLHEIDIAS